MTTLTVGSGQQFSTISAAVAAAQTGDTIDVQAGTYTNDFPAQINGLTIEGVGGTVHLVATTAPPNGKAIFDVAGNTTLKNLDFSGVAVPDANGAGVRYESGNLVIENSSFHNNQEGLLGGSDPAGSITINQSEFYNNGTSSGFTHNMYIGDIASFTITNSYIHDANTGHEIKSRAENNIIVNNRIDDNNGNSSYEIDLPNGGNATITGNTIQKSLNSGNHVSISYGEEGSLHAGSSVTLANNTFISDGPGAFVLNDAGNAAVSATNNSVYNYTSSQIDKAGHVSISGFTTLAVRPALDTSSPIAASGSTSSGGATGGSTGATTGDTTGGSSGMADTGTPLPTADTTPPTLKVTESFSGASNQNSDVISGTVSDTGTGVAAVEVFDTVNGVRTDLGSATLASDGSWQFTAANLIDGSHSFTVIATDAAGNGTAATAAGPADLVDTATPTPIPTPTPTPTSNDTTPPTLTVTESSSGASTQNTDVISGTAGDSGTGVAAVEVFDTVNGVRTDLGSAALAGDGSWQFTAANLVDGSHSFTVVATDKAGNGTAATTAGPADVVDTAAPTMTVTQALMGTTTKATNFISGTVADAGSGVAKVEVYDTTSSGTADLGAATISGNQWTFTASNLPVGDNYFAAAATDSAGNTTRMVYTGLPQTVVAAAPTTPTATVTAPAIQTVAANSDGSLTVTGVSPAGSAVTLYGGAGTATITAGNTTSSSTGAWAITSPVVSTSQATSLIALAVDGAGNTTTSTGTFQLSGGGNDTLSGIFGQSDTFAFTANSGQDIIRGFETTAAVGANHDVIDLAGTGSGSFGQLQPHIAGSSAAMIDLGGGNTITLAGVAASSLTSSDFRFS